MGSSVIKKPAREKRRPDQGERLVRNCRIPIAHAAGLALFAGAFVHPSANASGNCKTTLRFHGWEITGASGFTRPAGPSGANCFVGNSDLTNFGASNISPGMQADL